MSGYKFKGLYIWQAMVNIGTLDFKILVQILLCCGYLDRIEEADVQVQTDAFLDRPPTPLFVPAKTGLDAATQIQDGDVSTLYKEECDMTEFVFLCSCSILIWR